MVRWFRSGWDVRRAARGSAPFLLVAWVAFAVAGCGESRTIKVVEGTYGGNCHAAPGNATAAVAAKCYGRAQCDFTIEAQAIGDPAVGCAKDFVAVWRCGSNTSLYRATAPAEAGTGAVVHLSCS